MTDKKKDCLRPRNIKSCLQGHYWPLPEQVKRLTVDDYQNEKTFQTKKASPFLLSSVSSQMPNHQVTIMEIISLILLLSVFVAGESSIHDRNRLDRTPEMIIDDHSGSSTHDHRRNDHWTKSSPIYHGTRHANSRSLPTLHLAKQVDDYFDEDDRGDTLLGKVARGSQRRQGNKKTTIPTGSTLTYQEQRRRDYTMDAVDYEGRLQDSFFDYIKRSTDYDKNEVPWENGGDPVQVQMSAYLRWVNFVSIYFARFQPNIPLSQFYHRNCSKEANNNCSNCWGAGD